MICSKYLKKKAANQKIILQTEREIKSVPDKQKLRKFITRLALHEILNGIYYLKSKRITTFMKSHKYKKLT